MMTNLKLSFSPRAGQGRHSALVHQSLLALTCDTVLACPQGTLTRTLSYARVSVKFIRFPSTFQGVRIALRRGVAVGIIAGQTLHSGFVSLQRPIVIFSKKPLVFRYHWCVHFSDSGQEVTIYPV